MGCHVCHGPIRQDSSSGSPCVDQSWLQVNKNLCDPVKKTKRWHSQELEMAWIYIKLLWSRGCSCWQAWNNLTPLTMCKLLKIAFSWFHGSCTCALRGPAAPWLHWLLRSGSHIGFKCLACREILPRWLWYCWCTSVTTCYYHKQLWCVFRSVPKSEKIHGTGPDLLESRSSPGGGGGFFWRWVGKRETKRPGMKWWAHRDDVVEQARELCEGHLQLTFLAWRWESWVGFVVPVYTYRYPVIQLVNTTRDSWSCISPSSNGEICPGASTGVINEDVLSRWPLATMLNDYLRSQRPNGRDRNKSKYIDWFYIIYLSTVINMYKHACVRWYCV